MRNTHDYEDHEEKVARGRGCLEHCGGRWLGSWPLAEVSTVSTAREEERRWWGSRGGRCGEHWPFAIWTISRRLRGKTDSSTPARKRAPPCTSLSPFGICSVRLAVSLVQARWFPCLRPSPRAQ